MLKKCCWSKCMSLFKNKMLVNVINLDGVIGNMGFKQGLTLSSLNITIEKAFTGKNLKAVAININSPGGSPVQSELIAKRISQLSKEKNIPVIVFIEDVAASGGYWIACSASEVIAAENSILGSLGVIFSGFGYNKAIERIGIERRVHTQGESKSLLDPFLPEKSEDIEIIMKVQTDIYQNFKNHVHNNRKNKLKITDEELFSGAIWSGAKAVEVGLADKIGDFYSEITERFGQDVLIKIVNQEKSWFKRKLGMALDSIAASVGQFILSDKKIELR